MATVVKTQRPEDFLALVPQLAGFRPRNSIIIVAFRGNRTCAALRFNVPAADAGAGMDAGEEPGTGSGTDAGLGHRTVADRLVGILCKLRGADAVVPVVYTDDRFADSARIPHSDFARAVVERARVAGFQVRDALCVAEDAWGSYLDKDCPHEGRPLAAIESSSVNGSIPRELQRELGPVDAGTELPTVDLATKERVARLIVGLRESVGALGDRDVTDAADVALVAPELLEPGVLEPGVPDPVSLDPGVPATRTFEQKLVDSGGDRPDYRTDGFDEWYDSADADGGGDRDGGQDDLFGADPDDADYDDDADDLDDDDCADDPDDDDMPRSGWLPGFIEDALELTPDSIGDHAAAVLILCLQSPMLRDVVMLQWAFGIEVGELALDENARYFDGEDPAGFLAAPLMWGDGPRPNVPRVLTAIALVKALAARAPRSMRPPLLCQLAWFNWALGKSSLAGRFVGEVEPIDARYGLAEVLRSMLEAGHLPEWAFAIPGEVGPR